MREARRGRTLTGPLAAASAWTYATATLVLLAVIVAEVVLGEDLWLSLPPPVRL